MFVIAAFTLVASALIIFIGFKLYRLESVGRFGTLIIASVALLGVPFGTVFGILTLVLLTKSETMDIFRERNKYL